MPQSKIDQVLEEIRIVRQIIMGNGKPEDGLVFRLRQVENEIKGLKKEDDRLANKLARVSDLTHKWLIRLALYGLGGQQFYQHVIK